MHRNDVRTSRKKCLTLATAIALVVTLLGAEATSSAAVRNESSATFAVQVDHPASPLSEAATAPRQPSMDQDYAARETASKSLESFKGGDVVVIGSGVLVIVLLVVLILVVA